MSWICTVGAVCVRMSCVSNEQNVLHVLSGLSERNGERLEAVTSPIRSAQLWKLAIPSPFFLPLPLPVSSITVWVRSRQPGAVGAAAEPGMHLPPRGIQEPARPGLTGVHCCVR